MRLPGFLVIPNVYHSNPSGMVASFADYAAAAEHTAQMLCNTRLEHLPDVERLRGQYVFCGCSIVFLCDNFSVALLPAPVTHRAVVMPAVNSLNRVIIRSPRPKSPTQLPKLRLCVPFQSLVLPCKLVLTVPTFCLAICRASTIGILLQRLPLRWNALSAVEHSTFHTNL